MKADHEADSGDSDYKVRLSGRLHGWRNEFFWTSNRVPVSSPDSQRDIAPAAASVPGLHLSPMHGCKLQAPTQISRFVGQHRHVVAQSFQTWMLPMQGDIVEVELVLVAILLRVNRKRFISDETGQLEVVRHDASANRKLFELRHEFFELNRK